MSSAKGKGKKPPTGKAAKKAARPGGAEQEEDELPQAVIIADSFQSRFGPLTVERPRCLLPLANVPLIEYSLEFLALNGIKEVHLYCANHVEMVEAYIAESKWAPSSRTSPFSNLSFVRLPGATSIGDVMRDLDKRGVISGDFIVVHGDLVANVDLGPVYDAHMKRRKADPNKMMTMVLMEGPARARSKGITPIFMLDRESKRCLHYDEMHPLVSDHTYQIENSILELSDDFELRTDLIDPGIDICTPEALALWSDSFDYDLPRRNFVNGVLKDWELNGKSIYVEIPSTGYAARANNLPMYDAVSQDVLWRRTGPYIPENNIFPSQEYALKKSFHSFNVWEPEVRMGKETRLHDTIIGNDTQVGEGSVITSSVIGRGCTIGDNVTITGSFLWAGTTVADNTTVTNSVLAGKDLKVGKGCTVEPGCVLSFGVVIGDNTTVAKDLFISRVDGSGAEVPADASIVGPSGKGAAYQDAEFDDLDDRDPALLQRNLVYSLDRFSMSSSSISTFASSDDSSVLDDEGISLTAGGDDASLRDRTSSFASDSSRPGNFVQDAANGLLDALRDDNGSGGEADFDSAKMEFQGLRFASDASESAIRRAIASALARRAAELVAEGLVLSRAAEATIKTPGGVARFVAEVAVDGETAAETDFALALQRELVGGAVRRATHLQPQRAGLLLSAMLQQMYDLEILSEDGILAWWRDERAVGGDDMAVAKAKCVALVEWLENDDSDEDDSDDDDE